jgi:tRNA U34 5-carboxymethylaminomethyl modifying GTPase MnmE/TrmE
MDEVRAAIVRALTNDRVEHDTVLISNVRHVELMQQALAYLKQAAIALRTGTPEEFVLSDLQAARNVLTRSSARVRATT